MKWIEKHVKRSFSYEQYLGLIDDLLERGQTTGPNQSDQMYHYGKLNRQRMLRLDRTIELEESVVQDMSQLDREMIWLIITEGWCGDAAQNIPVIEKIAATNVNIETRYILRDEYPELMDRFLTNGSRSIPKLIAIDKRTNEILGTWGPRPAAAQQLFDKLKASNVAKPLIMENLQRWYHADRGRSLQAELVDQALWWAKAPFALAA